MNRYLLEEMTWTEIKEALGKGYRTVIICTASIEQHGPHLAELTDSAIGEASAVDLAKRLGDALVAPVIRPGLSSHHMKLPGSLTLRPEVFTGLVEDYVTAYKAHGFEKIVLLSSHGGNFKILEEIAANLRLKYPELKIATGLPLSKMLELLKKMEGSENLQPGACGGHACDYETSVMLHLYPEHVRMNQAEAGYVGSLSGVLVDRVFEEGITAISTIGVMGDPSSADALRGSRFFEIVQAALYESVLAGFAEI
ncbi:MAG: creatininase family protein [Bacillota bacterium]